ncbi:site-specific integrase [Oenococcus oeni]|uniref:site-specific integrase n=1 Tax=Oenococcus oeni TaxID=1247 RepID=UPI00050EE84B|nr:site-specific integrase [Oenococcus oeni]KGI00278.1 integrase [Oenococcus oeni IOEB_C52]
MASIKKRGNYWQVRVTYKDKGQYKTKNKSGFKFKNDAVIWASKMESGEHDLSETNTTNILLSDYFKQWYETYKLNLENQTLSAYKSTYLLLKKYESDTLLTDFNRTKFQQLINAYGKNHAMSTVRKRKVLIAASLKDAYADKLINEPVDLRINLVYKSKGKSSDLKFLEKEEAEKLINYCIENRSLSNFLLLTCILSGARFGEISALKLSDIDSHKRTLAITKSAEQKTNKIKGPKNETSNRIISMPKVWFDELNKYDLDDQRLFPYTNQSMNRHLKVVCDKLDIKSVTIHGLRHTHASLLLANGVSMQYVSKRLGHANLMITEKVYSHLLESKRKEDDAKAMSIF